MLSPLSCPCEISHLGLRVQVNCCVRVTPTFGGSNTRRSFRWVFPRLQARCTEWVSPCWFPELGLDPVFYFHFSPQIMSYPPQIIPPLLSLCYLSCSSRHFRLCRHLWASSVRTFKWFGSRLCLRISNFSVRQRLHDLPPTLYAGAVARIFHSILGFSPSSSSHTCFDRAVADFDSKLLNAYLWPLHLALKFSVHPMYFLPSSVVAW